MCVRHVLTGNIAFMHQVILTFLSTNTTFYPEIPIFKTQVSVRDLCAGVYHSSHNYQMLFYPDFQYLFNV